MESYEIKRKCYLCGEMVYREYGRWTHKQTLSEEDIIKGVLREKDLIVIRKAEIEKEKAEIAEAEAKEKEISRKFINRLNRIIKLNRMNRKRLICSKTTEKAMIAAKTDMEKEERGLSDILKYEYDIIEYND